MVWTPRRLKISSWGAGGRNCHQHSLEHAYPPQASDKQLGGCQRRALVKPAGWALGAFGVAIGVLGNPIGISERVIVVSGVVVVIVERTTTIIYIEPRQNQRMKEEVEVG